MIDALVLCLVVSFVVMMVMFPVVIVAVGCLLSGPSKDQSTTPPNKDIWGAKGELPPRYPNKNIWG